MLLAVLLGDDPVFAVVTVRGMSPSEVAGVTKRFEGLKGVRSVAAPVAPSGRFTLTFDAATVIDPVALQKGILPYEAASVEATLSGTLRIEEGKLLLKLPSGPSCHLNGSCAEKGAPPSKELLEVEARLRSWLAAKKPRVRVTGELTESCCEGEQLLSTLKAEALP